MTEMYLNMVKHFICLEIWFHGREWIFYGIMLMFFSRFSLESRCVNVDWPIVSECIISNKYSVLYLAPGHPVLCRVKSSTANIKVITRTPGIKYSRWLIHTDLETGVESRSTLVTI